MAIDLGTRTKAGNQCAGRSVRWRAELLAGLIASLGLGCSAAQAQPTAEYPDRPIRIIVPFSAISGTGLIARASGRALSTRLGVRVAVENIAGSDGAVGTAAVAQAKPDGYTLLFTSSSFTKAPYLHKTPSYDPDKDFVAVARLAVIPLVLVTSAKSRFKSFDGLISALRESPGEVRYATTGRGALSGLEAEALLDYFQVHALGQSYRNDADALVATAGGQADFFLASLPGARARLNSGALRALAVSPGRIPTRPEVPTLAEVTRRPNYEASAWFGILAPAGTPTRVITRLESEVQYELEVPAVGARIEALGGQAAFLRSAPFGERIRAEHRKWEHVAKAHKGTP